MDGAKISYGIGDDIEMVHAATEMSKMRRLVWPSLSRGVEYDAIAGAG